MWVTRCLPAGGRPRAGGEPHTSHRGLPIALVAVRGLPPARGSFAFCFLCTFQELDSRALLGPFQLGISCD